MKLVWSAFALSDRDEIYEFIESESPRSAAIVDKRISESAEHLLAFPDSGRIGRVAGTRELVVLRTACCRDARTRRSTDALYRGLHRGR